MKIFRVAARILVVGMLAVLAGSAAAQQPYPVKPIRMIVPYPPGGSSDPLARLVGQKLMESWGQQVIIDNRGGGNTVIGTEAVARSAPDGYTILFVGSPHVVNPSLFATPYDAVRDFAPIATITSNETILVVHPSVPVNNLQEFIALAKSRPGQLNYATSSTGGSTHLAAAIFESKTGVRMQHVPYKGGGPALSDLVGGQVQLMFATPPPSIPQVKAGRLRGIAVSGEGRFRALPQVPTFTEGGLPGMDMTSWWGVLGPAGTPKTIIDKLSAEIARILDMPEIREKIVDMGANAFISTPEQFASMMKADLERFARIIKEAKIKTDE
jgi:tripartite-type tricarboxylate transporter receptor subunit TctC